MRDRDSAARRNDRQAQTRSDHRNHERISDFHSTLFRSHPQSKPTCPQTFHVERRI
jgi:hypothetical protein